MLLTRIKFCKLMGAPSATHGLVVMVSPDGTAPLSPDICFWLFGPYKTYGF